MKKGFKMNVLWFSDVTREHIPVIGNKAINLVELYNNNFPIPQGFIITSNAFKYFLEAGIKTDISNILGELNIEDSIALQNASKSIKEIILKQKFPDYIKEEILEAYENLNINKWLFKNAQQALDFIRAGRDFPFVAVRSSAITEDINLATYLNVKGNSNLVKSIQKCWASFFDISNLPIIKDNLENISLAIIIQKQIQTQKSCISFSKNILNNDKNEIIIEACFGLAESIILNQINPDKYVIDKENLKIKDIEINKQDFEYVIDTNLGHTVKRNLAREKREQRILDDYEVIKLVELTKKIEDYYEKPIDIEFAIEGNNIYVLQTKPINTLKKSKIVKETVDLIEQNKETKKEDILCFQLGDINITLPKNNDNIDTVIKILQSLKENE